MSGTAAGDASKEAGFTMLDLLFVVGLIGVLSTLSIPGLMRARGAAQSASAIATVRVVNSAQLSFAITCGLGFYAPEFPILAVRPPGATEAYLPPELAPGSTFIRSGYSFSMAGTPLAGAPATCNGLAHGRSAPAYALVADQVEAPPGAGRNFGTNADGLIYEHSESLGATMPEAGSPPAGVPLK